jgi:hypothetical protein
MIAFLSRRRQIVFFAALSLVLLGTLRLGHGQQPATNAAPVATPPASVTAAMEQDFLARYQAVIAGIKGAKDKSALAPYFALSASDPALDPKAKEAFQDVAVFGLLGVGTDQKATYSFIPVPVGDKPGDDKPILLAGKMYTSYLPPVVELKTTLAPPDHPDPNQPVMNGSTVPLCVENGKLMLVGVKELVGAEPPPMDNPAENFGLTPNHRPADDKDVDDDGDFKSLDLFLAAIKQSNVEVLSSGQNEFVYYALCRVRPNFFVYATDDRPGMGNYFFSVKVTDLKNVLIQADAKQITLAEDPPGFDGKGVPVVQGSVYKLPAGYDGPVNVQGTYGDKGVNLSKTVYWK